jgi:light-regulated signal transduction histidine kinase (bacteriophytochrome)
MTLPKPLSPDSTQATALVQEQAQLAQAQAELTHARATLEAFSHAVSHDLRAHLRHITAYSGLLREELGAGMSSDATHFLDTVTQAARLLGQQMEGLVALSKLDRTQPKKVALDQPVLIALAQASLAQEAAGRQIDWQVADDFPVLHGDAAMVQQVWQHVLSNALKFTRPRAVARIQIGWQTEPHTGHCALFVKDNGVGFRVSATAHEQIFGVFRRLHSASEFEGLGLGLALARKLVERHAGSMAAEGGLDAGCVVRFSWPQALGH